MSDEMIVLSREAIQARIPHRYENVLIDRVAFAEEGSGVGSFEVRIMPGDDLGRQIFALSKTSTQKVLTETLFMEILALSSICTEGIMPEHTLALFASISNFKKFGDSHLGEPLFGRVRRLRSKAGFYKYEGSFFNQKEEILATGDVSAIFLDTSQGLPSNADSKTAPVPAQTCYEAVDKSGFNKDASLVPVDAIVHYQRDPMELTTSYTYPSNHPLIHGHFPGKPVMMGIMQWMGVSDSCLALALKLKADEGRTGSYEIFGDAELVKSDGLVVGEIRRFKVRVFVDCPGILDQAEILETHKVIFRSVVHPGDIFFTKLNILEINF